MQCSRFFANRPCLHRFCRMPTRSTAVLPTGGNRQTLSSDIKTNLVDSHAAGTQSLPEFISAWECLHFVSPHSADVGTEGIHLTRTRRMPLLNQPDHVLIRVKAASVNPVDLLMLQGYGAQSFRYLRQLASLANFTQGSPPEFPLTPGRDFAGEIVDLGPGAVSKGLTVGQKVTGATWPHLSSSGSGALAEYLVCPVSHLAALPPALEDMQAAAAVGYAGLTAWSALSSAGGMHARVHAPTSQGPMVLVTGATGGVGLITAQLARLWGATVHVTCPGDSKAVDLMKRLRFNEIIVYPDTPCSTVAYDIIVDCVRPDYLARSGSRGELRLASLADLPRLPDYFAYLKPSCQSRYVSLNPPLLHYMDVWGPVLGAGAAAGSALGSQLFGWAGAALGVSSRWPVGQVRWAFFKADGARLSRLLGWLSSGLLQVPIDTVVPFSKAQKAFSRLQGKGVRGKVVVAVR